MKWFLRYGSFAVLLNCFLLINNNSFTQVVARNIQNVDSKSINVSSSSFTFSNFILDWNIGELFSKSITDTNQIYLTEGFLQPKDQSIVVILPTDIITIFDTLNTVIQIYPNPVI